MTTMLVRDVSNLAPIALIPAPRSAPLIGAALSIGTRLYRVEDHDDSTIVASFIHDEVPA